MVSSFSKEYKKEQHKLAKTAESQAQVIYNIYAKFERGEITKEESDKRIAEVRSNFTKTKEKSKRKKKKITKKYFGKYHK